MNKKIKIKIINHILTVFLLAGCFHPAAEASDNNGDINGKRNFRLRYVINIAEIDSTFVDNAESMQTLQDFLKEVGNDSLLSITGVDFKGTASPDGTYDFNVWLSKNRLRTFKEMVKSYVDIPDSLIHANVTDIPWDEFRAAVAASDISQREEILSIIDEESRLVPYFNKRRIDQRLLKLKALDNGKAWEALKKPILFDLRYGNALFYYTYKSPLKYESSLPIQADDITIPETISAILSPLECLWTPRFYIKTNLIGWLALSLNIAAEIDMAPHWSFAIPVYFSGWDYFKSTVKFRNLTLQPELRYWPGWNCEKGNEGFFVGAHFGMMYYNFAVDGQYRYQDRRGKRPALGGGLGLGYRWPISADRRWHMEVSAGAGVYSLDYDVFENTPNYKEGQWVRRNKKTFVGLDQATISFSYNFGLTKAARTYKKGGGL